MMLLIYAVETVEKVCDDDAWWGGTGDMWQEDTDTKWS